MAERTRKFRIVDAPVHGTVDLELRFYYNQDMVKSLAPEAFVNQDDAGKRRGTLERAAKHVIVGWSIGPWEPAAGFEWLLTLDEQAPEVMNKLLFVEATNPASFGRPRLVDATDLGNE